MNICDNVVTDKHWFQENILCYLSNAVKYSSGGEVTVRACLQNEEGQILKLMSEIKDVDVQFCIIVEDNGIGISKQCKTELFQPFQQTMRLAGGTGLGLYSLAKRMEALGGKFGVADRDDGAPGSQFWFSVPYVPDIDFTPENYIPAVSRTQTMRSLFTLDVNTAATVNSDLVITIASATDTPTNIAYDGSYHELLDISTTRPLTALVVEDSLVIAKSTTRMLTQAGYSVDTATNGAIGLEKMKEKLYDVVLMDLQMPIMDGLEATRRLRAFESNIVDTDEFCNRRKQFIIGVSANGTEDVHVDAMNSGMCDFCPKPFSLQDMTDVQVRHNT
jgi:CheY-like chemotaxis protein